METLFQKKLLTSQKFILKDDCLEIEEISLSKKTKYSVKLEKIGFEIQYHATNTLFKKFVTVSCIIAICLFSLLLIPYYKDIELGFGIMFYAIAFGIILGNLLKENRDDIYLVGPTNIIFYRNRPSETEVLTYIETIKNAVKKHLIQKYTAFDELTTPEYFYNCINWLYEKEIISREQFLDYKASFDMQKLIQPD